MHKPGTLVRLSHKKLDNLWSSIKNECINKLGEILSCDDEPNHHSDCICVVWFPELKIQRQIYAHRLDIVSVPSDVPLAEPVWEKWLPPCKLPDTGPKVFKAGQIWTWSTGNTSGVFRVMFDGSAKQSRLAGGDVTNVYPRPVHIDPQDDCACHAFLVAEPGCTPIPPEILFGSES